MYNMFTCMVVGWLAAAGGGSGHPPPARAAVSRRACLQKKGLCAIDMDGSFRAMCDEEGEGRRGAQARAAQGGALCAFVLREASRANKDRAGKGKKGLVRFWVREGVGWKKQQKSDNMREHCFLVLWWAPPLAHTPARARTEGLRMGADGGGVEDERGCTAAATRRAGGGGLGTLTGGPPPRATRKARGRAPRRNKTRSV